MSIREGIEKKYKQSLKERNANLTNTIRLIKSAIKNKDIAARSLETKEEIKDQEILSLLQNLIKQRKDSVIEYEEYLQDKKRKIRLLDPEYVEDFIAEFEKLMGESVL